MAKSSKKTQKPLPRHTKNTKKLSEADPVVISKSKGLVFKSESEVFDHFKKEIGTLEEFYSQHVKADDILAEEVEDFDAVLAQVFESPIEIWRDNHTLKPIELYNYIARIERGDSFYYYIAQSFVDEGIPTFIFTHFPTKDDELVNLYRKDERVYSEDSAHGFNDALADGDEFAKALYRAMLTIRSDTDIPQEKFADYIKYRDIAVEEADEVRKSTDLDGNILVTFIKEFHEDNEEFFYICITLEDSASESHFILFSFPTQDKNLVDRYRLGEPLNTEEVVQEESH